MKLITFFSLLFISLYSNAQNIKGTVVNLTTKEAVPYANIILKNNHLGGYSKDDGSFIIPINKDQLQDSLLISSIGFTPKVIPIKKLSFLITNKIFLEPKATELDMVHVTSKMPTVKEIIRKSTSKFRKDFREKAYLGEFYYAENKFIDNEFVSGLEGVGDIYFEQYQSSMPAYSTNQGMNKLLFDELRANKDHNWNFDPSWDLSNLDKGALKTYNKYDMLAFYKRQFTDFNFLQSKLLLKYNFSFIRNSPLIKTSDYTYNLRDIENRNNEPVYVIEYHSKNDKTEGEIYIRENFEVLSITSSNFEIKHKKNYLPFITPNYQNKKESKGSIQFGYVGKKNYTQKVDYQVNYDDPKKDITYKGTLEITNFSTVECYQLRAASIFRSADASNLLIDSFAPYAKGNSFWTFRSIKSTTYSENINRKEIGEKSLNERYTPYEAERYSLLDYDKDDLQPRIKRDYFKYVKSRELLKRSTYGDLRITDNSKNKKALKHEFDSMFSIRNYKHQYFAVSKEIMDSLDYHYSFLKQLEEGSEILNNLDYHTDYEASYNLNKAVTKNLADTLFAHKEKLSERYLKESKGNIIALWLESNTMYTEYFPDSIRLNNPNHIFNALQQFDLNDTTMYTSPVLAQYISELIFTQITVVEDEFTPLEGTKLMQKSNSDVERFQAINTKYIKNKSLQEKVLYEYVKEYVFYDDTLSNQNFNYYVHQFDETYQNSDYTRELAVLSKNRKGFIQQKLPNKFTLLDPNLDEVIRSFNKGIYIIDFWASWCGPCVKSMKEDYPEILKKYNSEKVNFVFISFDQQISKWTAFIEKNPLENTEQFRVLDADVTKLSEKLNIQGYPTQLIVKDGVILKRITGANSYQLEETLKQLIN
ncbi:hypothetical protein EI427_24765 [Flammeovirga pectinis]|uniref:Thioredoxin domain-containing protein n=1 Tax=Flammeovirga pectinis TaxID=2494373 RepID=A0A3Q9FT13_9BACT|nr:thioredoxin domain-containing protein [Flammeovirga pectinis]AZQ65426.1 hypothetical protein EI427_24765 [Flammeovirga pectinis]